ncbi:MAG TPA: hypothetical protein VFD70_05715 [Anaerolineae bacterium]|nr:hypothetical protein [Anaerolineae bacterium]
MDNEFQTALGELQNALTQTRQARTLAENALVVLQQYETDTAATIAKYLRSAGGVELDVDAIKQTVTRPYTLIPQNEQKALLVHWRGVKLPIFGWVKKQEGAFTIAEVSRGMDLLTPFPDWLKSEMGWQPPAHAALIDGTHTSVRVTSGDSDSFKKRYDAHLGSQQQDGSFKIKPGDAWIKLVAQLVKDGILPWQPQPVAREDWDANVPCSIELRDYQIPFEREFRDKGAVFFNLPPGGGKTYLSLYLMAHLRGSWCSAFGATKWNARRVTGITLKSPSPCPPNCRSGSALRLRRVRALGIGSRRSLRIPNNNFAMMNAAICISRAVRAHAKRASANRDRRGNNYAAIQSE